MGYIYCITNLINSKRYIGKTSFTIQNRWKQHLIDCRKNHNLAKPLYSAINKYGIENFSIQKLEEVDDESKLSEREIFWIQELQTYGKGGYNATKGGDGQLLYDHSEILELYRLGYSTTQIKAKIGCSIELILRVLKAHGIHSRGTSKIIDQFDIAGNFIQSFDSSIKAKEWVIQNNLSSAKRPEKAIVECCSGNKKTAFGYKWKYREIPE